MVILAATMITMIKLSRLELVRTVIAHFFNGLIVAQPLQNNLSGESCYYLIQGDVIRIDTSDI